MFLNVCPKRARRKCPSFTLKANKTPKAKKFKNTPNLFTVGVNWTVKNTTPVKRSYYQYSQNYIP